jgi:ubiquinone/menaquinone biosynthesis C-methylase UbiE
MNATATPPEAPAVPAAGSDDLDLCPRDDWRSQFANPRGLGGWLAGWLMARKNAAMNAAAVDALAVAPGDRVLEIGFGHGRTLALLAERATRGLVAGVDPSEVMLAMASRRNRRAIRAGRVELRRGGAAQLPYPDAHFDKAIAVNSVQFWPGPARSLAEVRRVLRPGGTLLLGIRLHDPAAGRFTSPGFREEQLDAVQRAVADAGFHDVAVERRHAGRQMAILVTRG